MSKPRRERGQPRAFPRALIRNEWTGTHHAHRKCRGLTSSRAPHVVVSIPWNELSQIKTCGYCLPDPKGKAS